MTFEFDHDVAKSRKSQKRCQYIYSEKQENLSDRSLIIRKFENVPKLKLNFILTFKKKSNHISNKNEVHHS